MSLFCIRQLSCQFVQHVMPLKSNVFDKLAWLLLIDSRALQINVENKMLTREQKIDETKDCIIGFLESNGPQSVEAIVAECREQAWLGVAAYAISGLQFDGSIRWNQEDKVYEVA